MNMKKINTFYVCKNCNYSEDKKSNEMIPLPGTYQAGHPVTLIDM